ncbi:MAG TPA: hypothetical protein VLJ19_06215 [Variovorax sp.]|nr:hypothetical protein [Variovorax sp.]
MGWLFAWLIFGLLAAYEVGELAMHAGSEWTPIRAIAFLVGSMTSLVVIAQGAVRRARPRDLRSLLGLSLLGLAGCLWALYGSGHTAGWVTTAMAGAAYLLGCLLVGGAAMFLGRRRQAANEERVALARVERERQSRLERVRAEPAPLASASAADNGLGADSDFVLPARPKWDDSN